MKRIILSIKNKLCKYLYMDTLIHIIGGFFVKCFPGHNFTPSAGGSTNDALYCYGVWMRHLVLSYKANSCRIPKTVAELGPGMSIGCGLAALLCGAERYIGLDVVEYSDLSEQAKILDELVMLLKSHADIPEGNISPKQKDYSFPSEILPDELLRKNLTDERINKIRCELNEKDSSKRQMIRYIAPWEHAEIKNLPSCDFVFSQAVLEHIDGLNNAYSFMSNLLKSGSLMSHQIDFRCHSQSPYWNRHWGYSDFSWKLIRATKLFLINRQPCSAHLDLMKKNGFCVLIEDRRITIGSSLKRKQLSRRFSKISDEDFKTSGAYILAKKL